ncbi:MAG: SDR family oxidoreductase [Pseudonocardiaceae bacterium]
MRIAVAGGTGVVGRHVVASLATDGHEPVVLARSRGVNVVTGQGLDAALTGVQAVVDVSGLTTTRRRPSVAFFAASTRQLLAAGQRAGVAHYVALSIVAVDRVDYGYFEGQRRQEDLALAGQLPASVLRATQVHEFAGQILAATPGPLAPVPRMLIQPVVAREVATRLADLATGSAVGLAPEFAGSEEHQLVDLTRRLVRSRGQRRWVIPIRMPGAVGRDMATGGLLPQTAGPRGTETFDHWLTTFAVDRG